jgi:serine protease inhibitor
MLRVFFSLLTIGLFSAIGMAQPQAGKTTPDIKLTAQASNDFACDLYRDLSKEQAGKNVFLSPWSISSALAMTMEGARNQTAAEMGQALRLPKELQQDGDRPWKLGKYHAGFAELQRLCNGLRDAKVDQADRDKLVLLRKELNELNAKLQKAQFTERDITKLQKQAEDKAAAINALQNQVDLYELHIANAIWGEKTYPISKEYVDAVERYYGAGLVRPADFLRNYPAEREAINRWVEEQTKDRIKELVPKLPQAQASMVRMILVNAIYFKGQWSEPFKKDHTKQEPFLAADGGKRDTAIMNGTIPGRYAAFRGNGDFFETPKMIPIGTENKDKEKLYPGSDGFLVAELPYKGDRLSMVVIVPQDPKGLAALEGKLSGDNLSRWLGKLDKRKVHMAMPKFKMETTYSLEDALKNLGMKQAFDQGAADFSGLTTSRSGQDRLHISKVIHKTFVEVNEEGTEAAAATAVIVDKNDSKILEHEPIPFRADHPFLFVIRHNETGSILFMGRLHDPR